MAELADDRRLRRGHRRPGGASRAAGTYGPTPAWFGALVIGLAVLVVVLSWWPVRNMASPGQAMNASFDPFHLVNTYGAFGTVGRTRYEVIVEGAADGDDGRSAWREYEFKGKPGDPRRRPPQVAPYHYRLDWLMWFIPLSPRYARRLVRPVPRPPPRERRGDAPSAAGATRSRTRPPEVVRARLFHYRYSTWREWRETGAWWVRTLAAEYVPPFGLADVGAGGRGTRR